jgi:hypothetical protein
MNAMYKAIYSGKSNAVTSGLWVPMVGGASSQFISGVTFVVHLESSTVEVQPGIQYSDDGVTWDAPEPIDTSESAYWVSSTGRTVVDKASGGFLACPADFGGGSPPTERLFVRFGLFVINQGSDGKAHGGRAALEVRPQVQEAGSFMAGPIGTATGGGTTEVFTVGTGTLSTRTIRSVRYSWEQEANTNDVETWPGYQTSEDGVTWSAPVSSGLSPLTTEGIKYGTTFTALNVADHQYIRFGWFGKNGGGGADIEACVSRLRVDWRG